MVAMQRIVSLAALAMIVVLFLMDLRSASALATPALSSSSSDKGSTTYSESPMSARLNGVFSVFQANPSMCFGVVIRIAIAVFLDVVLDGFLKTVVTPAIAATGIGIVATPLTFFIGQALQPMIHSVAFIVFDDRFLMASLEATGIKQRLLPRAVGKKWHKMTILEGIITRYCVKAIAGWCLGWASLFTILPVVGPVFTALLSGWVVAWDYVYVPLAGMGHVGVLRQFRTVLRNFRAYFWFGFWAVLIEEIPLVGPVCHVYNVYSAAFFLERLYLNGTDTNHAFMNTDADHREL